MQTVIIYGKHMFCIGKSRLEPIGYRIKCGMKLSDGQWLFEVEPETPGVEYGSAFKRPKVIEISA